MNSRVIEVVDHDPNWKNLFEIEKVALTQAIGSNVLRIDHIGSTSVVGLAAKPVIDILVEVSNLDELDAATKKISALGYIIKGENGISGRRFFQKGGSQRSHHVHVFQDSDIHLHRHRAFKAYLIAHPKIASKYGAVKKEAVCNSDNDIALYMKLKNDFIQKYEKLALEWVNK